VSKEVQPTKSELRQKTVSGGLYTIANQIGTLAIQLVGTVILARILDPADFGVIVKVTAITGLTAILGDLGLSLATIQSPEINNKQLSALFWLNLFLGLAISLSIAAAAPAIAWFYDDDRLILVTMFFAILAFVNSLAIQHKALLKRNLNFKPIFFSMFSGALIGTTAAILTAPVLGYYALVVQLLVKSLITCAGFWMATRWAPSFHLRRTGIRPMLGMAGNFTGWNVIGYGVRNMDNILIGKYWGDQALAYYTKAYSLVLLPLVQVSVPISQVAIPALSRLQTDAPSYRSFFLRGCSIAMILQLPIAIFSVVAAEEIILTLLGPKWVKSLPIFLALSPALLSAATSPATSWIFLSRGDTKRMMRALIVTAPFYFAAFLIGLPYGALGVAIAFSTVSLTVRIPNIWYAIHPSPVYLVDIVRCIVPPVVSSVIAAIAVLFAMCALELDMPYWVVLVVKGLIFASMYLFVLSYWNDGKQFFKLARTQYTKFRTRG